MNLTGGNQNRTQVEAIPEFDIEKEKKAVAVRVQNSQEVQNIISQINLDNLQTIMTFGSETAQGITSFSDRLLNTMETTKVEDSGELLNQLTKIMDKFDIKEFEEKNPGFLEKLFNKTKNTIEALFKKYHTMGGEIDKVYVTLKQYEAEIVKANENLDEMYKKNIEYYEALEQYIYAGELAIEEIKTNIIPELERKAEMSGNEMDKLEVSNMQKNLEMMEQRVYDLKLAEHVAIQGMPSIKMMQHSNFNLIRKINSSFIVTMPIFKNCIINAIMLKRQQIQAKGLSALDEKTNELLLRNAQNTSEMSKQIEKLTSGSIVDVAKLEESWRTIVSGIEETKRIQEDAKQKRIENTQKLEALKQEYQSKKF